jgi:PBP1b-binding outer membrane lipoprotein LpoB
MKSWPALLCVAVLLAGCGSSRNVVTVQDATRITKGVELTDLQRALQEGAINQREYETLRKAILRRSN